jgi:sugar O-acyltransferase (sialic acid O-acetyltransferase NeuD family)
MKPSLLIVGAGGHGKVVADAAIATEKWGRIAFLDDDHRRLGKVLGLDILGSSNAMEKCYPELGDLLVALGDNCLRLKLLDQARAIGYSIPVLRHPMSSVSPTARIGEGTVVFAQAVVNPDAEIGRGVIVNTGAIVEHDCRVGDGAHLSPGACMGGRARMEAYSWLGIGASVLPKQSVGTGTIVGAGAVVLKDLPDGVVAYGTPAKVQKTAPKKTAKLNQCG